MNIIEIREVKQRQPHKGREFYIVEKAENGEILSTSEIYTSKAHATRAARMRAKEYKEIPLIVYTEDQL